MRIIVAGSRDFNDYNYLKNSLNKIFSTNEYKKSEIEIICGEAKGADTLGKKYAIENKYKVVSFPANWEKYGKMAGYIRNAQMRDNADALIVFWDGKSKGTEHMIKIAKENNMPVTIFKY